MGEDDDPATFVSDAGTRTEDAWVEAVVLIGRPELMSPGQVGADDSDALVS